MWGEDKSEEKCLSPRDSRLMYTKRPIQRTTFLQFRRAMERLGRRKVAIARLFLPFSFFLFGVDERGSKYFFLHRAIDFVQTEFEIVGALFVFIFDPTFSMLLCYYIYDYCYAYEHLICNLEIISKISRGKFYSTFLIRRTN